MTLGAEDFSYMLQSRPGAFFFVGCGMSDGVSRPHHKSVFDLDEKSLLISVSCFLQLLLDIEEEGSA